MKNVGIYENKISEAVKDAFDEILDKIKVESDKKVFEKVSSKVLISVRTKIYDEVVIFTERDLSAHGIS